MQVVSLLKTMGREKLKVKLFSPPFVVAVVLVLITVFLLYFVFVLSSALFWFFRSSILTDAAFVDLILSQV